jgi:hypothetical protein
LRMENWENWGELGTDPGFLGFRSTLAENRTPNPYFGQQFYGGDLVGLAGLEPATNRL